MTPRLRLIVGNWKMHKTIPEALGLVERLADLLKKSPPTNVTIVIAPPFTALSAVASALTMHGLFEGTGGGASRPGPPPVSIAAQDMHWEDAGAVTGEGAPPGRKDLRRRDMDDGDAEPRRCVGETDRHVAADHTVQ